MYVNKFSHSRMNFHKFFTNFHKLSQNHGYFLYNIKFTHKDKK